MKKLGLVLLAFIVAVWFGACVDSKDSKDSHESQTINANDSQSESSAVLGIDSNDIESTTQDIQADSLNDSDLALLDEVFWDRVFYDFWTNEKCLAKEIVTNKKQRDYLL